MWHCRTFSIKMLFIISYEMIIVFCLKDEFMLPTKILYMAVFYVRTCICDNYRLRRFLYCVTICSATIQHTLVLLSGISLKRFKETMKHRISVI